MENTYRRLLDEVAILNAENGKTLDWEQNVSKVSDEIELAYENGNLTKNQYDDLTLHL